MAEQPKQIAGREKPKMRPIEVYDNLNGFVGWDYSSYPMSKAEAEVCIEALRVLMEQDRITEGEKMIEGQVITTWTTPEQKLPPEDEWFVVTFSGSDGSCHYDHALGTGSYWDGEGWIIAGLSDDAEFTVHAWADLDPYEGGENERP